jgi:parvulin-like peptidyl-prolyl isomerase
MKKIVYSALLAVGLFAQPLATVDGEQVTNEDLALLLKQMRGVNYEALTSEQKSQIINQLVDRKVLMIHASKQGVQKTKEFREALEKIKSDLALEVWMQQEFKKVKIPDSEAKAFYNKNKFQFSQKDSVRARHILLKTEKEAKAVIKELKGSKSIKDKFIELAKTKSTGPSGKNGGDLGFFDKTQMVAPFSEAAFKLGVGQYTKSPVKTQFGYHVIFVEEKKAGGTVEFAKVKPQIVQQLQMQKFGEQMKSKTAKLRKKSTIKIY